MRSRFFWMWWVWAACSTTPAGSSGLGTSSEAGGVAPAHTSLTVRNATSSPVLVYVSFGADSTVNASSWAFCAASSPLNCSFTLAANSQRFVPPAGYLNATVSFGQPVGCGNTKAELNLNNPHWYDIVDISLVDGFSNKIQITANDVVLGPPKGKDGNEAVFGLYPYGCDLCTARQSPPCNIAQGGVGCKAGTQYNPTPPCQYQGPTMGGGGIVVVELVP